MPFSERTHGARYRARSSKVRPGAGGRRRAPHHGRRATFVSIDDFQSEVVNTAPRAQEAPIWPTASSVGFCVKTHPALPAITARASGSGREGYPVDLLTLLARRRQADLRDDQVVARRQLPTGAGGHRAETLAQHRDDARHRGRHGDAGLTRSTPRGSSRNSELRESQPRGPQDRGPQERAASRGVYRPGPERAGRLR